MTLKQRKDVIKDYVKRNRDFAFFCAGATCTVLAQMTAFRYIDTRRPLVIEGDVIVNEDD